MPHSPVGSRHSPELLKSRSGFSRSHLAVHAQFEPAVEMYSQVFRGVHNLDRLTLAVPYGPASFSKDSLHHQDFCFFIGYFQLVFLAPSVGFVQAILCPRLDLRSVPAADYYSEIVRVGHWDSFSLVFNNL